MPLGQWELHVVACAPVTPFVFVGVVEGVEGAEGEGAQLNGLG